MLLMRPPRSVKVYPHEVKPGDEYSGYVSGSTHCFTSITVSPEGVPLQWGDTPIERHVDYFERDLTWQEEAEWYRNQVDMTNSANQLNLMGLHTDLSSVGGAFHEMWNGWVKCDWYEQLVELVDEEFFIAGIAEAPMDAGRLMMLLRLSQNTERPETNSGVMPDVVGLKT